MVFAAIMRWEEKIRTRIHSIRLPIKDARTRNLVTAMYFFTPIVGGWFSMSYVLPDPEKMREKLTANLSAEDLARIQAEKDRLQRQYEEARQRRQTAGS
jgi:hypothetical protein